MRSRLRPIREAIATLFPVMCGGCGVVDTRLCLDCVDALGCAVAPEIVEVFAEQEHVAVARAQADRADPPLRVITAMPYEPVLRTVIDSYKERGRADLAKELSSLLVVSLRRAVLLANSTGPGAVRAHPQEPILLIPVPSRKRARARRGYDHIQLLLERAVPGARPVAALRHVRHVADQSTLNRDERSRNLHGAFLASDAVRGSRCVVVDDLVTTGATLAEATRALRAVHANVICAVAIARVERLYHIN